MSTLDPYEDIRQAYLVGIDSESGPFEDLEIESLESPHTVVSPTSLPDSIPPACHVEESKSSDICGTRSTSSDSTIPLSPNHLLTHDILVLVPSLRRTARMAVRVSPAMSSSLSARISEVAAMFDLAFCKRFSEDEDEEVEESSNSDSKSEGAKDEGLAAGDDGPNAGDESLAAGDEDPDMRIESFGQGFGSTLKPERPERLSTFRQPTLNTWTDPEDGMVYIDVPIYLSLAPPVQTPPSPKWSSDSLPISPEPTVTPSPISSPMISLTVPSPIALPVATLTATIPVDEDYLEHEQERTVMTFGDLWRLMLALEAWARHVETRMEDMSWAGYDDHRLVHDLLGNQQRNPSCTRSCCTQVTNNESLDLPDLVTNRNKSLLVPDLCAKKLNSWVSFGEKDQL
uniref:Uncharacterized protein n=1 Tax=Tanacetum cinerariifolium TaxID=118510 RepID=A0A699K426_TANCI|nr:hypothetical protein [Tanacetum cinerariifolium]